MVYDRKQETERFNSEIIEEENSERKPADKRV